MKRKSLLIMLLMALFAPLAMNAQQQTMTIGSTGGLFSTGNSSTGNFVPGSVLGNTYCYRSLTQFIYTASEMGGAKTIKSVAFYHNNGGSFTTQNLTIYLAHTTASTISGSTAVTSGTAYYTGTNVTVGGSSEGWQTFTLDTDFEYNGTDNLLVVVARESSSGYLTAQGWKYTSTSSNYRYIYRTSDSSGYGTLSNGNGTYPYTQSYNRPNIQIGYTTTVPFITLDPSAATVFTGFTQTLTATYGNVTNPTITYSSSNTSVATVTGNGTTATVTAVAPGTATITATMNGSYTAICSVTVEDPSYCTPAFGSNDDCITNITLGNINNTTASTSTNGYGDYTSMSTELEPGTTATLSLTSGAGSGTHAAAVWIDFDNSYTFESSERVGTQGSISASATVSINLTIPNDAAAGSHRMRVVYQYNVDATAIEPCASATYGEGEDYTVVITSPCPKPTGLTLSGIATHGVTATWDAEASDVFQYAMVMGANINPSTVTTYDGSITATGTTCSMSWNNLLADTDYTLVLRRDCGNNEYSIAVAQSFTTLESGCLKPTNVVASNLTVNSAHISWDGNADSYNVKYATATVNGTTLEPVFEDSFENGLDDWTIYIEGYQSTETNDFNITDWHLIESNSSASPHTGSYMAMSRSYDGNDRTVDNWLVSPQMTLGDVMTFWAIDDGTWHEHLEVWVSTGTNAISDFVKAATPGDATSSWTMKTVDLSSYAGQQGYVAIRHNDTGKDWIFIDDIGVYKTVNTYSYGTFTTLPPTSQNSCDITGLSPETLYVAQVQSDCGDPDGTSSWSSVYFTTPDACSAPTNLVTSNITANTATLSWSDNQDSYNVQYRKVYFYEDFEGATLPTGWTTIDNNGDGNTWSIGFATSHSGDNGAYNLSYVYSSDGSVTTTPDDYLVSPQLDLQGTLRVWLSGYARSSSNYSEHFEILLSTTGNSASDFTTTLVGETTTTDAYVEYTADLSSYAGRQGYIAIHHFNCTDQYYLYVDDFGLYGTEDWVTVSPNPTNATTTLTGLEPNTGYEWQVQGLNCNSQGSSTDWSAVATFTTPEIPAVPVESITASDVNMLIGETATITPTVLPADATNPVVTYTSADDAIATVDANGLVTGVAAGTTTITIAATDGSGVSTTINVTVTGIDVTGITAEDVTVVNGQTATISYTVAPANASDQSVTFTSADATIATVDAEGVVTGVAIGTTTITIASVSNPEVTATINVYVTSNPEAAQFTLVAPATAQPGEVITVEAYLAAPTSGNYDGFTGLVLGIQFDTDAFELNGNPTAGPVATASQMSMPGLPNENHPDLVQYSLVMVPGNPNTTTGLVFSAQFTVLEEVEFGSYTFTPEVTNGAANFIINMSNNPVQIPYEVTPSTVEVFVPEHYYKTIVGYSNSTSLNYFLIASPIGDVDPTDVTIDGVDGANMVSGNYDLYYFDQSQEFEWINYRPTQTEGTPSINPGFILESSKGYLYANSETVTLVFTGRAITDEEVEVPLVYDDSAEIPGWNLLGNPFIDIAYLAADNADGTAPNFYTMDQDGNYIAATNSSIEAMEGVFVQAMGENQSVTFTTTQSKKSPVLALNLSHGHGIIDRAIVRFDGGDQLSKLQFRQGSTKVYIPMDGKDYAVVSSEEMGEMPVNFKAESNGTYNLSLSSEEVSFAYLHLIDNLTGADIDLLETPSYSFDAKTTDYESRFKLVFATGNNSDTFAFFSNGSFVINNEGEATLQVIDVMGRILKSETINGCANVNMNAAPGVYMLRLINGADMKVQKVVVK